MVSNANQIYTGIFKFLTDEKKFKSLDTEQAGKGALSNAELIQGKAKIVSSVASSLSGSSTGDVDKYVEEVISWNQELRFLNKDQDNQSLVGSTQSDLKKAQDYLEQNKEKPNAFKALTNQVLEASDDQEVALKSPDQALQSGDQRTEQTNSEGTTQTAKIDKKAFIDALQAIYKYFDEIDKQGTNDHFLTNPELMKAFSQIQDLTKLDPMIFRKIVENNQEFKFLSIEDGDAAWKGMSRDDLNEAIKYLTEKKFTVEDLVKGAMPLGAGETDKRGRIKSPQNNSSNQTSSQASSNIQITIRIA